MPNYNGYSDYYQNIPQASYYSPYSTNNTRYYGQNNLPIGPQQPVNYGFDQSQTTNSIVWVQGEAGANAYPVGRGQTIMLMDANPNSNMFYLKSADPYSGRPLPLEKYKYIRVYDNNQNESQISTSSAVKEDDSYVPREEFDNLKTQIAQLQKTLDELTK